MFELALQTAMMRGSFVLFCLIVPIVLAAAAVTLAYIVGAISSYFKK